MPKPRLFKVKDILPPHTRVMDRYSVYMPHSIYSQEQLATFKNTHRVPKKWSDKVAYYGIESIRWTYDHLTGYNIDKMSETKWLIRCIFLETVAGVPGMVGGMGTHLKTIRDLKTDKGRIHHLLEEAENERFHLHFFLELRRPGRLFRLCILLAQTVFFGFYMMTYLVARKFSHRFVGYLEEQACHTYTNMLRHIDDPNLSLNHYKTIQAPEQARLYWSLPDEATMRDVIEVIRADESSHRQVNHFFADIEEDDQPDYYKVKIQEEAEKQIYGRELHESKIPLDCRNMPYADEYPYKKIKEFKDKDKK